MRRERLPARPGTAPAGVSLELKPRAQLEGSLEGHLEEDSSSEEEEVEPGEEADSSEEELEPERFPRSPSPGAPAQPQVSAAPASADAGDLELRHEAATVDLAEAPSASIQASPGEDDEFDYAFAGAAREAPGHVKTFEAAPLPAHLVSDTKELLREEALLEGGEEEEEEESQSEEVEAEGEEGEAAEPGGGRRANRGVREVLLGLRARLARRESGPGPTLGSERRSGSGRPPTRGPKAGPSRASARRFGSSRRRT